MLEYWYRPYGPNGTIEADTLARQPGYGRRRERLVPAGKLVGVEVGSDDARMMRDSNGWTRVTRAAALSSGLLPRDAAGRRAFRDSSSAALDTIRNGVRGSCARCGFTTARYNLRFVPGGGLQCGACLFPGAFRRAG